MQPVVIIDYGMGNLRSVQNKFRRLGTDCLITAERALIEKAPALVLPGVGHFGRAMDKLRQMDVLSLLQERVLGQGVPVLGICLGMQLLTEGSEEGSAEGLGWVRGRTVRFNFLKDSSFKVPHIGWNSVQMQKYHPATANLPDQALMYFVHSYHVQLTDPADALQHTHYGYEFVSAVQHRNVVGYQYHPEKSQDAGLQLIKNFAGLTAPQS